MTSAPFVLVVVGHPRDVRTSDGMPAVYLLKSVLWMFCALMFLQGMALIVRRALFLAGHAHCPITTRTR